MVRRGRLAPVMQLTALALRLSLPRPGRRSAEGPSWAADAEAGRRVARTLGRLGGIYTKLGQCLSLRADLFPDAFRQELAGLLEGAPALPFDEIRAALQRGLGPLPARFRWIDPEPLGTASVAQVHRARLTGGPIVAVKVRRPDLTPQRVERDLASLRRWSQLLRPWVPQAQLPPLLAELGRALHGELDFFEEARVAEEIGRNLADDPRIVVPRVHWEACGEGVLTIDYVPRIRLDDGETLRERGVDREACLAILCEAYGRQVFEQGLFHADPHLGNIFLVDEQDRLAPPGTESPRILFLDFGLARRLDEALRQELREGIHSLLKRDLPALLEALKRLEAVVPGREAEAEQALRRALESGAAGALGASAATIESLKQLGKQLLQESKAFLVPADLLLYARTLAYVYALAETVAPGIDPMPRLLPHLLRFLADPPAS
jgi:ubiquinone biosynthesis protein